MTNPSINNFSPLPFYKSKDDQNARRWWVYRTYPLYGSSTKGLPFQILRENRDEIIPGKELGGYVDYPDTRLNDEGIQEEGGDGIGYETYEYDTMPSRLYIKRGDYEAEGVVLALYYGTSTRTFTWSELFPDGRTGVEIDNIQDAIGFNLVRYYLGNDVISASGTSTSEILPVKSAGIYTEAGELVRDGYIFDVVRVGQYDVIYFNIARYFDDLIGRYYLKVSDGVDTWYSDIMTLVDDNLVLGERTPYVTLEWWDEGNFFADDGLIYYGVGGSEYHNRLYINSNIAKPQYLSEEEGESRDGYFFPTLQISKKQFRFTFTAPEYMTDVVRLIPLADHLIIRYMGREYKPTSSQVSVTWEDAGDVAVVEFVFDTDVVAKKIGKILSL